VPAAAVTATATEEAEEGVSASAGGSRTCTVKGRLVLQASVGRDGPSSGGGFAVVVREGSPGALAWVRTRQGDPRAWVEAPETGAGGRREWTVSVSADAAARGEGVEARYVAAAGFVAGCARAAGRAAPAAGSTELRAKVALPATSVPGSLEVLAQLPKRGHAAGALPAGWSDPEAKWSAKHEQVLWNVPAEPGVPVLLRATVPTRGAGAAGAEAAAPVRVRGSLQGYSACGVELVAARGCEVTAVQVCAFTARFV